LPYVLLVLFVSASIGWVSYRAGEDAIGTLSHKVLSSMVARISHATEQHLAGAVIALNSVYPEPESVPRPPAFSDDLSLLESSFWVASGLFMKVNHYVYFGGTDGRFVGVNRKNKDLVELSVRESGMTQRRVYAIGAPGQRLRVVRTDNYDPRVRPWYESAVLKKRTGWSTIYNDFSTKEPTITLSRPIYRPNRTLSGVIATDITLKGLTEFLRTLEVSENGVSFLLDGEGHVIATSGKESPFKAVDGMAQLMRSEEMSTPQIRNAHAKIREWKNERTDLQQTILTGELSTTSGRLQIATMQVGQEYGLDWTAVVAIPREDFMGGVTRSFTQGILVAIVCVIVALALGLTLLNRVLQDIRKLTIAAKRIGDGEPLPLLDIKRHDEIGQLALTFSEMEHNLRIDKLTAVFNRASLIAQIGFLRRQLAQRPYDRPSFALLFIDLDHFKSVNDHYGHGAGDKVLVTVATRLREAVRLTDVVARYGGDEFVVLLKGVTASEDVIAAENKIRQIVEKPVTLDHGVAQVGVSIGWAMFPEDGDDVDALLKIADKRMFDTKKSRKAAR
jgi:diguanylate cyclase (GGDEF)-like protein